MEPDTVEFYEDKAGKWRWKKTAPNGKRVSASTQGYENKSDAIENYEREIAHAWVIVEES